MPSKIVGYAFEPDDMEVLRKISKALYGNGSIIHPDQRRDLANLLNKVLGRAIPLEDQWGPTNEDPEADR